MKNQQYQQWKILIWVEFPESSNIHSSLLFPNGAQILLRNILAGSQLQMEDSSSSANVQFSLLVIGLDTGRSQGSSGHCWVRCNAQICFTCLATLRDVHMRDKLGIGVREQKN